MPSALHEYAVEVLSGKFPGLQTKGFRKTLKSLPDYLDEVTPLIHITPDAFLIRESEHYNPTVVIFEVEVGNPINDDKMIRILDTHYALDGCSLSLELNIVDKWGNITSTMSDHQLYKMSQSEFFNP